MNLAVLQQRFYLWRLSHSIAIDEVRVHEMDSTRSEGAFEDVSKIAASEGCIAAGALGIEAGGEGAEVVFEEIDGLVCGGAVLLGKGFLSEVKLAAGGWG